MGALDRWLDFRKPGDAAPAGEGGDTGDTGLKPAENQGVQCRQRVSPPPATPATTENSVEYPAEVRSGQIANSTVSPVVTRPATPSGDMQSLAGCGVQGSVAAVTGVASWEAVATSSADRPMRVAWQGWSERTPQSVKDCLVDLAEWRARQDEVPRPCVTCGDTLFWRIARGAPWRCRTCQRPDARMKVQWLAAGGGPTARSAARQPCAAPGCARPACAWSSDGAAWCDEHGREWLRSNEHEED